jgi:hypothetical protein
MPGRRISQIAVVAGTVLLLGAGGAWLLLRPPAVHVRATAPVLVTGNDSATSLIEAHNTPSLAVDPSNGRHLVLAERIDRPRFGCRVHVSSDGGATWTVSSVPLPAGKDTCFIPDVAFVGRTVYLVYLTLNTHPHDPLSGGNDPNGMYLERSTDGGLSFEPPLDLHGHDNLQPRLAADQRSGRLYITYVRGSPLQNDTPLGFGPPPNPIMVISSTDGVRFTDPVQVNDLHRLRVAAATPAVTPNGDLLVLYEDYHDDLDDYNNKAIPYQGRFTLVLARSHDWGRTFDQHVVDDHQVRPHRFLIYLPPFPALAVAPDGRHVYAAWSDARDRAPDIFLRRSEDGGTTWKGAQKINQRPSGIPANFELPALDAPSPDRVDAIFYAITGSRPRNQLEFTTSTDAGAHFQAPVRISRVFDATVGVGSARDLGRVDWGAHLAIVSSPQGALAAWSDSSQGNPDTQRQDIFFATVSIR